MAVVSHTERRGFIHRPSAEMVIHAEDALRPT